MESGEWCTYEPALGALTGSRGATWFADSEVELRHLLRGHRQGREIAGPLAHLEHWAGVRRLVHVDRYRGRLYASASIAGGVVCLLLGAVEGGRSPWFVSVVSMPDGTILVRPGTTVMYLRVLTALLASGAGVCFFYVSLFSVDADIRSIAGGNVLSAAVVALYLVAKIIGSQSRECIVVSQQRVDMWGKGGIHYSIPWSDQPRVIGQRNSGKSLLIGAGQNIDCLVVFTTLRIRPSRVRSLLAYYQTTPGALDLISTPEARDEAMKALS